VKHRPIGTRRSTRLRVLARVVAYAVGCALVLFVAHWTRLLNIVGLDNVLEQQLLSVASYTTDRAKLDSMRLIYIDEKDNGKLGGYGESTSRQRWRAEHARLLYALEAAGARAVAFDLVFPPAVTDSIDANHAFATALAEVRARGKTRVLIGYDPAADFDAVIGAVYPRDETGYAAVAHQPQGSPGARFLTSVLLAESEVSQVGGVETESIVRPLPMGLALYLAMRATAAGPVTPWIDAGRRQVTFTPADAARPPVTVDIRDCTRASLSCPLGQGAVLHRRALLPVWMGDASGFIERSYASVALQPGLGADYAGKIVLVGARTAEERVVVGPDTPGGTVWGYQVHARVLADLLSDSYLRRPSARVVFAALLVLAALGVVARLALPRLELDVTLPWLGKRPMPLGLLLVAGAHGFVLVELLREQHLLTDIGYQWLALVAGYYLASRPLLPSTD
jgi:CHASE2 domain-containing sensor protein